MIEVTQETYSFLIEAYKKQVESFFDDPISFSDGEPIRKVFENLRKVGSEIEVEMESLAGHGDLERLEEDIRDEEELDKEFGFSESEQEPRRDFWKDVESNSWEERAKEAARNFWSSGIKRETSSGVQEKLNALYKEKEETEQQMIGSWVTYEIQDEDKQEV
jgi:hypothetical protein